MDSDHADHQFRRRIADTRLVAEQTTCSFERAGRALAKFKGDIVYSIMFIEHGVDPTRPNPPYW